MGIKFPRINGYITCPFVEGQVFLLYNANIRNILGGDLVKRRIIALFTAFFVLFSTTAFGAKKDLKESYSRTLRIGLKNMMTTSLNVTFNGNYRAGSDVVTSGTSFILSQSNGKILFNNIEYSEITFVPDSLASTITLQYGAKKYNFLGSIIFKALADGNILPINLVDIETYLKGVVGFEMSNSYPLEALKSQAVAARNYALANIDKHSSEGYDLSDGTSDQVYRGYNSAYGNVIRAVEETKGMILVYNDSLVSGFYSASNGGYVESSKNAWGTDIPYLQVREDSFDVTKWSSGDKNYTTVDIDTKLKSKGLLTEEDRFIRLNIDTIQRNESTRVGSIEIVYADLNGVECIKNITKEKARTFLSFASSLYDVTYDATIDTYTFSGMGNGHGIGLSQIGAKNRANSGQKYDEILSFYYAGSELKRVADVIEGFSISKYEAYVGDTVNFTAKASTANTLYKYTVGVNGQVVYTRDYTNDSNASYKVDRAGYFTVNLYIKDVNSSKEYDEHKTVNFSAISLLEISGINVLNEKVEVNKPVTVNVEINGGASAGVQYSFEAEKDHIIFHLGTADVPTFTFTPQLVGEYTLYVSIKDKASAKTYDDMTEMKIMVNAEGKPSTTPVTTVKFSITRNLTTGVTGNDVKALQEALKTLGYFNYSSITNYYGAVTASAVSAFQKKSGLYANGSVDSKTAAAINSALIVKSENVNQTPAPPPPAAVTPVFTISRTLKKGVSGNDVKQLQEALKALGYFNYQSFTTYFGDATVYAVTGIQKKSGLATNGIVDSKTATAINSALVAKAGTVSQTPTTPPVTAPAFTTTRTLKIGMSGTDVKQLQEALKKLGVFTYSSITNYFGTVTQTSVKAFQKANGMSQTGVVDAAVVKKINEKLK
ncbi:MAG: SpoIID/LytB protein [Clostridiales bacterium]|jgi:stage II sporulation protein D|nr:SpoIID/LytB protein [Clostridiales bacterium]